MIDVTLRAGVLSAAAKAALMNDLSEIVLKWEGFGGDERAKQLAFAFTHELQQEDFTVGGRVPEAAYYRVVITTPEGAIQEEDKPELVREVTEAVLRAEGAENTAENRGRVWCILGQIADGNWGGGGRIFPYQAIRARLLRSRKG